MIATVEAVELENLDDADARADGFQTIAEMREALASFYPDCGHDGKKWFRVMFALPPATLAKSE